MLKRILSLLFMGFLLVSAKTYTKTYTFDKAPVVKDGRIYLERCRPSMQGFAPAIPAKGCKIGLAPGLQARSVKVSYNNLVQVPGTYSIEISAGNNKKDALYPGIKDSYPVTTQFKYGIGCAVFVIHPVQYNPVRDEVCYYKEVTVSVETEPVDPARDVAAYVMTPFHRSILQFTIDNPEILAHLELTPRDANDYELLLITYTAVQNAWDTYIAFNKRRGLRTKLALISDVLATSGLSDQDKIRNYIKNEYENSKILFAVLGGDVNQIKHQLLYSEFYDHDKQVDRFMMKYTGADMYYGTLDGNWNTNGNNKFGEPGEEDMLWEVYVSRIPADNNGHITAVIGKTIHYVDSPKVDQATNVLLAGEFLTDDSTKIIWGIDNLEYYVGYKDAYGWQTYGCTEPPFIISRISDKETGAPNGWGSSELRNKILAVKPTWIAHDGAANTTYCMTMGNNQISSTFTNTGSTQNYFILVSTGDNAGQFSANDSWMETLLFQNEKGAVATVASWDNNFIDRDDNNSPNCVPFRHLHDALLNPAKRIPFLEAAHATGKEALIDVSLDPNAVNIPPYFGAMRYVSYVTNTLGDPALNVWTDTPKQLTQPFPYIADGNAFIMVTPPYTCVILANDTSDENITGQVTGYKYTGGANFVIGDSTCLITDSAYKAYAASNDTFKLYIKAPNYLPAAFKIPITQLSIPLLISPPDGATGVSTSPTLDWSTSSGALTYGVQVATDSQFTNLEVYQINLTETAHHITGLAYNTTYYWRANAANATDTSAWSPARSFITLLPTPTLVSPEDNATGVPVNPTLSWNASPGAATYGVQVATDSGFTNLVVYQINLTETSHYIVGLLKNTTYYWRVIAASAGNTSAWSPARSFTTGLAAPALVSPEDKATGTSVNPILSWNASSGAATYGVQVATDTGFTNLVVYQINLTATSHYIAGLLNITTYYWRVNAANAGDTSGWSPARSFTTNLAAPALVSPANNTVGVPVNPTLVWNVSPGAATYGVQVATDTGFTDLVVYKINLTTISQYIAGLVNDTKYYWRVNASNAGGTSAWSTPWNFTVKVTGILDTTVIETGKKSLVFSVHPSIVKQGDNTVDFYCFTKYKKNATLIIFDALGNSVFEREYELLPSKSSYVFDSWNLRNKLGRKVGSGNYLCLLQTIGSNGETGVCKETIGIKEGF